MRTIFGRISQFDVAQSCSGRLPATLAETLFGLSCTAALMIVRSFIDLVAPTAGPFALIYPATLIATLFGRWRAGLVTAVTAFAWVWYAVLPHASRLGLAQPSDVPRTAVNVVMVLVVLGLAEIFRAAVRGAGSQRDAAIASLEEREARLRELNHDLERQVAERTRELGRTWDVSPDLLSVLNPEGYFERSNPAWQATLGLSAEVVRKTRFFDFIHPDDVARTNAAWDEVNRGNPVLRFENRYRCGDGSWRWLSWVVVPEGGKFYGSARDVTAAKEAEERLAAAQDALRQSQKMEAVGQLTGGVAHDFNNLLTVIRGSAELLLRPNLAEERRSRYIAAIADTADRAAKLTGQLLAFARRQALQPRTFDAGASIASMSDMITTLTGSRIRLTLAMPDEACLIDADPSQFDTAIVNMAANARDAMAGEGTLAISVDATPWLPGEADGAGGAGYVAVRIADTGIGIAEIDRDRIFEPFFTTKDVGQGTGLGLSQVFGFAKQSGGEIRVESQPGRGTTFTLYLPRSATAAAPGAAAEAEPEWPPENHGTCVLVVEDNADVGAFAATTLAELGYRAVLAPDGAAALAELARDAGRFDVVFSDVVMPGMNGVDLAQEIRRRHDALPVILTSGYSHVLADNGTHGFELLHKPYSMEQLSRVLRNAAAWRRQRVR